MIKQLYPSFTTDFPLNGSYLQLNLHQRAKKGEVFIYANYISSLDGRISLFDAQTGEHMVPSSIANPRDWRLYQELAGQSDVMLTSARYFRQLAKGNAQDLLPVGAGSAFEDIKGWRKAQGLKSQPDIVVLSNSLEIPQAAIHQLSDRKIIVLTSRQPEQGKIKVLEAMGVQVVQAEGRVSGQCIRQALVQQGYRSAYMIAGPKVHHTLVADGCVDELFLTLHMSLAGGESFCSVLEDAELAVQMKLLSLYLDEEGNQMFMRYQYQPH